MKKSLLPPSLRKRLMPAVASTVISAFLSSTFFSVPAFSAQREVSWSLWNGVSLDGIHSEDVESPNPFDAVSSGPSTAVELLQPGNPPPDDPVANALTIDEMINNVSAETAGMAVNNSIARKGLPGELMSAADHAVSASRAMYADIKDMFTGIDGMKIKLEGHYAAFNRAGMPAGDLNAKSDEMAGRVAQMRRDFSAMKQRLAFDRDFTSGLAPMLEDMAAQGKGAQDAVDRFSRYVKDSSGRIDGLARNLEQSGWPIDKQEIQQTRDYLNNIQKFASDQKSFTESEVRYINDAGRYLENRSGYLDRVSKDFDRIDQSLAENERYFSLAKVRDDAPAGKELTSAGEGGEDVCAEAETRGLSSLKECAKSCRTVCRWKEKVSGSDCYECPSGSPDSCWDVGAWPADHPWCAPGGVCHDDPMLVCSPFGTTGPNLEHLECTNCKKRPDMCWQKVADNTTTLTNCKLGCWNGKCVYKGRYKEFEWDGTAENIHCYECVTPPPPPSCEDLGWGYDWENDCKRNCNAGMCEEVSMPSGKPKRGAPEGQPGGQPGGQQAGQQGGGQDGLSGGEGQSGGSDAAGGGQSSSSEGKPPSPPTDGNQSHPPTGTPTQPSGGGGAKAPSGPASTPGAPADSGTTDEPAQPPKDPGATTVHPPPSPTDNQPRPPDNPPEPPDNPMISFYRNWLNETEERIKSREDIIADPDEGPAAKAEAQRQLDDMTRSRDYLRTRVRQHEEEELERRRKIEEERKRREEYERTRPPARNYGEEMRRKEQEWRLNRLRETTEALKSKLEEAGDIIGGRVTRIETIDREIAQLEAEIKYMTEAGEEDRLEEDFVGTQTRLRQKRIKDLKDMRNQFARKLGELQRQYKEELETLKNAYQRSLWSIDENARRQVETQRMDEYFELLSELRRREHARDVRMQTFDTMIRNLENAALQAEADGDDDKAEELREQAENIKRGKAEWDETLQRQVDRFKDDLRDLEIRNGLDGVGPDSPQEFNAMSREYKGIFEGRISQYQDIISALEGMNSRTPEQNAQLKALRSQVEGLRAAIQGLDEKNQAISAGSPLTDEDRRMITDTTTRVAAGMMNRGADKSFAGLFLESMAEESVHNMNPLVMAKKYVAFGWGMTKGVATAVVGLAELGVEAVDTLGEAAMVDLGFEEGGIFGTENLEAINSAIDAIGSNANFDGAIKVVVALGGAIDAELKKLEKSRDIDWASAELGGNIAGQTVVGDMVVGAAVGKAWTAVRGVDEAADIARAADTAVDSARAAAAAEEASAARRAAATAEHVPGSVPGDVPSVRGPPGAGIEDDIKTIAGGLRPEAPTVREPFAPASIDDAPTKIGGLRPGEGAPTVRDLNPGVIEDDIATIGGKTQAPPGALEDDIATLGNKAHPPLEPVPPPPAGIQPAPASVIGDNRALGFVDDAGRKVDVNTGEYIKSGSTSSVYVNADNPNQIVRITDVAGAEVAEAARLDEVGRSVVEGIQKSDDRIRIVERFETHTVNDPSSPLHGKNVEISERAHQGDAKHMLKDQGGVMSEGQARAFNEATQALNEKGYAWLDNHTGNYTFEPVPGGGPDDWRVVILDPGGIAPMKGATAAEKAANARAIQQTINAPEAEFTELWDSLKNARGDLKDMVLGERRGNILDAHGRNIDIDAMGLKSVEDIGFNPGGTLRNPRVGELFGQ